MPVDIRRPLKKFLPHLLQAGDDVARGAGTDRAGSDSPAAPRPTRVGPVVHWDEFKKWQRTRLAANDLQSCSE